MNQPSAFQAQYPLSPRKFWKKILPNIFTYLILSIIVGAGFGLVLFGIIIGGSEDIHLVSYLPLWILASLVAYIILVSINAWYIKTYIRRYYYDCGEQFITIKKGVFAPTEIHVQYQKIQDVYVDQDIIDRIMGLYDVHIASATMTSGIEAHIDGVSAEVAENLKNIILGKIHNAGNNFQNNQNSQSFTVQPIQVQQPVQQSQIQFDQKISSEAYPISGSWIWEAFISAIGTGLILDFFLGIFLGKLNLISVDMVLWPILVFFVGFFYRVIYLSIWKSNYYFEFLPDYILLRTGVVSRQENHLPYKSIQNISNSQGIFDRMLGLSTVSIENAATQMVMSGSKAVPMSSGISIVWQPKAKAEELNQILNDIVSKINPQSSSAMGL